MDKELRLDKFLADMGKGTRSALKEAVRKGRVRVNGEVIKKADIKVRIPGDTVTLDGEEVAYAVMEYYMLNKPQGVVSATEDNLRPHTGRVGDPPADPGGEIPSGKADDGGRRLSGAFFKAPVHGASDSG